MYIPTMKVVIARYIPAMKVVVARYIRIMNVSIDRWNIGGTEVNRGVRDVGNCDTHYAGVT